ncbi:hypothetical protein V6N13_082063 [Hibiscus sabdariffa]
MSAQIGSSPPYTWHIYSAKGLLDKGLGNDRIEGHTIDIRYTKVIDLIDHIRNEWNTRLIRSLFESSLADRILCIPLAHSKLPNSLVWRCEGSGQYSPESGYRLLIAEELQSQDGSQQQDYKAWLANFLTCSDSKCRVLVVLSYWSLCYARNQLEHEGVHPSLHKLKSFIYAHIVELDSIDALHSSSISTTQDVWSPPEMDIIKFNFDSSFNLFVKSSISGILVRNSPSWLLVLLRIMQLIMSL